MSLKEETQWLEVWKLYDADKDNLLTKAEFMSALRVLGRRYTKDQMDRIVKQSCGSGNTVDYDTYVGVLGDLYDGPTMDDLVNAFRAFDGKDCGYFTPQQIQSMLTSMGDKLDEDEVAVVMDGLPAVGGKVDISKLVQYFNPPVPSGKPNIPELMREIMREEVLKRDVQAHEVMSTGGTSSTAGSAAGGGGGESGDVGSEGEADDVDSEMLERETFL